MKVYISGPITGKQHYREVFYEAAKKIRDHGDEPVNAAMLDQVMPYATREEYLKIDLDLLELCDAIYMLPGWEMSPGANREYGFALAQGMIIIKAEGA